MCSYKCCRRKRKERKHKDRDHESSRHVHPATGNDNIVLANESPAAYYNARSGDVASVPANAHAANNSEYEQVDLPTVNTTEVLPQGKTGGVPVFNPHNDVSRSGGAKHVQYENIQDPTPSPQFKLSGHVRDGVHKMITGSEYEKPSNYINMVDRPTVYEQLDI